MLKQPHIAKFVGVVGAAASGKNTVSDIFADQGFMHVSSSDKVRAVIESRGLVTSRALQNAVANEMRHTHGVGYWIEQSTEGLLLEEQHIVISGLYALGEGEYLKSILGGVLVGVKIDEEDDMLFRYQRTQARLEGNRDQMTADDFKAAYNREHGGTEPHEANVDALLSIVDYTIYNSGTIEMLHSGTLEVIEQIERGW